MEKSSVESSHLSRTQGLFATGPRSTPDEICVRFYADRQNTDSILRATNYSKVARKMPHL